ncbi:MAG: hypothetical protein AB7F67_21170 [Rhodospirillaceae bacterium]
MKTKLHRLGIAGLLGTAACTNAPIVYDAGPSTSSYMDGEFEAAARDGEVRTEVLGNPFGVPQDRVESAVTSAMRGANRGPDVAFTTHPGTTSPGVAASPYKVVVAFDLPVGLVNSSICAPSGAYPVRSGGAVSMTAAFCRDGSLMSHGTASFDSPVGIDSPGFRALVRNATYAMIPPIDRKNVGGVR